MCRLLATLPKTYDQPKILGLFADLSICGMVPKGEPSGHLDGWGIACLSEKNTVIIKSQSNPKDQINKSYGKNFTLAHLRKASIGENNADNTHPFKYNKFCFAHNGTIFDADKLPLQKEYIKIIKGETDSEKFFAYLMQLAETMDIEKALSSAIDFAQKKLYYTSLTCIIASPEKLMAVRHYNPENKYIKELAMKDYYTLSIGFEKDIPVMICSEKISDDYIWQDLANNSIFVCDKIGNWKIKEI